MGDPVRPVTAMGAAEGRCKKANRGKPVPVLSVHKRGGVRSRNNRLKKQNKNVKFSIWGTKSAGLKAKKDSLMHNIKLFNYPSCITIQETKLRTPGIIKLKNYQVFEKVRPGQGGGLLTAVIEI